MLGTREAGRDELLINSLKTAFVWERRHSSVGSERLISNSRKSFCVRFHSLAQALLTLGVSAISDSRRVAQNCAVFQPNFADRRTDRENNVRSSARVEWSDTSRIIAYNLSKAGWSWGCVSAIDSNGRTI